MATVNPFDLLGDDDTEDPSQLSAAQQQKVPAQTKKAAGLASKQQSKPVAELPSKQQSKPVAELPSKPHPPAQAVREAKAEGARGGGRGGGRGYGRGRGAGGFNRESSSNDNAFGNREFKGEASLEEADAGKTSERRGGYGGPRGPFRGGRRGGFGNGEVGDGERPRRAFERRSGTGRGNEFKREGAGRGNWGTQTDELAPVTEEVVNEGENNPNAEKPPSAEEGTADGNNETSANETEEKEPENKEMTLDEYEKVQKEKNRALQTLKTEERKVDAKEFESMQQLANKKNSDDIFIKLGSDKKKDAAEKEERAKKAVSINEFLKPAEGERFYTTGGRGRGRGRGSRGYGGGNSVTNTEAPSIEDPGQFPTLSSK